MIYEYLSEKMGEDCPALSELESILDDLAKAQNDFRKDGEVTTGGISMSEILELLDK